MPPTISAASAVVATLSPRSSPAVVESFSAVTSLSATV